MSLLPIRPAALANLLLLIFIPASYAADLTTTAEHREQQRWAAIPVIASSPETGLMLGGMLVHFLPTSKAETQASTIDLYAYGTTKGQYAASLSPNLFLAGGAYRLDASLYGNLWQANYYGVGNDTPDNAEEYEATNVGGSLVLERRFFDTFVLALHGHYEQTRLETTAGGMLATGGVAGASDGHYAGVGIEAGYDSRDNTHSPLRGTVVRYRHLRYDQSLGSNLDFGLQSLDLNYYLPISWRPPSLLAFAVNLQKADGTIPFRYLPSPDGTHVLRGIENGRYRDRTLAAVQSEYRFPIAGRFSGTAFVEAAQVADDFGQMSLSDFKTSVGGGLRYALNPEQRFNLRGDVAWVDGGFGVILNIREAF